MYLFSSQEIHEAGYMSAEGSDSGVTPPGVGASPNWTASDLQWSNEETVISHFTSNGAQKLLEDVFLLPPGAVDRPVAALSTGERERADIAWLDPPSRWIQPGDGSTVTVDEFTSHPEPAFCRE